MESLLSLNTSLRNDYSKLERQLIVLERIHMKELNKKISHSEERLNTHDQQFQDMCQEITQIKEIVKPPTTRNSQQQGVLSSINTFWGVHISPEARKGFWNTLL